MDAKNRVTIPSRWRRGEVDEFFVIPNLKGGFMMVIPPAEFTRLAEERSRFMRQFSSRAQHLIGDKQGRIVLPDEQCKLLNLRSEVVLVGSYYRFEIWGPEAWQKTAEEDGQMFGYMLERIGI